MDLAQQLRSASGRRGISRRSLKVVLFAVLFVLGALAAHTPEEVGDVLGPLGVLIGQAAAGLIMFRKAKHFKGRDRLAWTAVSIGFLVATSGVLVVAMIGIVNGSAPAFGPADLIFVASYLLILAGFSALPHMRGSVTQRIRIALDGLIGAVALAAVLWTFVLRDLLQSVAGAPTWERIVASTYPFLDVAALIVVMIVTVRRGSFRFDPRLLLFGVGLILQAIADMTFFATGVGKTFAEADPSYELYILAAMAFLGAAMLLHREPKAREYADRNAPWWSMVAPYASAVILVVLALNDVVEGGRSGDDHTLILAVIAVGVLVVIRQGVAIRENRVAIEAQRSALVSSISHELRTPLTSMVGFLEILRDDPQMPDDDRGEMTAIVHQQAAYMARIVDDLILLARAGPDAIELKERPVEIGELVEASIDAVERGSRPIVVDLPSGLVVNVDPDRFQQMLVNLLTNAVRYGSGRQMVVGRVTDGAITVEVHDDGPGVPKKYELRIWERFERGPHRYNAQQPGSGIGLAVVDAVAKAHGGRTGYRRSELLGGACFWVELPGRALGVIESDRETGGEVTPLAS